MCKRGVEPTAYAKKMRDIKPLGNKAIIETGNNANMTKYSQLLIFALLLNPVVAS